MKQCCAVCGVLFLITMSLAAQEPTISWWFETRDVSAGNAALADLDRDGRPEIAFSMYRNDSRLVVLNAEDGSTLWEVNTGGCNDAAPVIHDVDGDGELEIVLPGSCVARTFCYDGATGALEWSTPTHGSDSPPTIGDVDNDGRPEILHGQFDGWVICLNGEDGSVLWEFRADSNAWVQTEPALLDVDGNGQLDFVIANWSFGDHHRLWAFRGDDHALLWESDLPNDVIYHGASHADIDGDGRPELAIGDYSGQLMVLNAEDGSRLWTYSIPQYAITGPTSIADLDGDHRYEIIAVAWFRVFAFNDNGDTLWSSSIPDYGSSFRGAAITDVDGDGGLDVVLGTSTGTVMGLRGRDGARLWSVDLRAHHGAADYSVEQGPVLADFDGNGTLNVFVVGGHGEYPAIERNYGRAYALDLGSPGGPDWPMFRRDIRRSGWVPDTAATNSVRTESADGAGVVLGAVRLRVPGEPGRHVWLQVTDLLGRSVFAGHVRGGELIDVGNGGGVVLWRVRSE